MDGIVFGIKKQNNTNFLGAGFAAVDDGYDTNNNLLRDIAIKLLEGAEAQSINQGLGGYGQGAWLPPGTASSAGNQLMCNLMSPQDLISNFLLGQHTFFLSRPHHLGAAVDSAQSTYQSSLAASLFKKAQHPDFIPRNGSSDFAQSTVNGLAIDNVGEDPKYITAVPYHIYVDSFQNITCNQLQSGNNFADSAAMGTAGLDGVIPTQQAFIGSLTGQTGPGASLSTSLFQSQFPEGTDNTKVQVVNVSSSQIANIFTVYTPVRDDATPNTPLITNSTLGGDLPSLDKNSVKWTNGNLNEPVGVNTYTSNILQSTATTFSGIWTFGQEKNYYTDISHAAAKGVVTQGYNWGTGATSSDNRFVYLRGCLNLKKRT